MICLLSILFLTITSCKNQEKIESAPETVKVIIYNSSDVGLSFSIIPCLILYPTLSATADNNFHFNINTPLIEQADKSKGLINISKLPVPMPKLKTL